jgi:hypothetical protein
MSDLRGLIEAARADGPSAAARAKVWTGVTTVVGEAAGAASSVGGGTATGTAGAAKMLVLGTLLGGSVTVGIGVVMLMVGRTPLNPTANVAAPAPAAELRSHSMLARTPAAALSRAEGDGARLADGARAAPVPAAAARPTLKTMRFEAGKAAAGLRGSAAPQAGAATESDTLAREAAALAEARGALARRDALSALQIVRSLRALPGRQLVPEELAVEAQALRGLGLDDDANAVETRLRARFPDSVLGR